MAAVKEDFTQRSFGIWTIRIVTLAVVLVSWELYGRTTHPALFAPPSRIMTAFWDLAIASDQLWVATRSSIVTLLTGFSISIVVGTTLGLLMGRLRLLEDVLDPYVSFLYALPSVALVPLYVIWMGIGQLTRTFIVFEICLIPILLNTMAGAKQVSPDLVEVARNYGATRSHIMRKVVLPSLLPYMFTGIYVAVGSALIGTILGELLVVVTGLGGMVLEFSATFRPDRLFVPLLMVIAVSLFLQGVVRYARHILLPWVASREP